MGLSVCQSASDLHDADGPLSLRYIVFPFLGGIVGEHFFQLSGGDEEDVMGKKLFYVIIMYGHIFLGLAKHLVHGSDGVLQGVQISVFSGDDLFPIPLIHIDGMDIVRLLVPAYGAHVCIQAFPH